MKRVFYLVAFAARFLFPVIGKAQECSQLAYTANAVTHNVSIIDLTNRTAIGNITLPTGSLQSVGIAIPPNGKFAYVTNFGSGDVSVIDLSTNQSLPANIPLAPGIIGIAITPDGKTAYVTNQATNRVAIIDLTTNTASPTQIALPIQASNSDFIAISPNGQFAYVTAQQTNGGVSVIDLSNQSTSFISLPPGSNLSTSLAITPDGTRAYVINQASNDVSIIDLATNIPNPTNIPLPAGSSQPTLCAITPDGRWLYICNGASNDLSLIDLSTNTPLPNIPLPASSLEPLGIAISSDQKFAYITNINSSDISVIDLTTNIAEPTNIPLAAGATNPYMIALFPCTQQPPSSAVSATTWKNAYFWQTDLYNKITWSAPSGTTPSYYAIYSDGTWLGDVSSDTFVFENHYLKPKTSYTYSVYAFNGSGSATLIGRDFQGVPILPFSLIPN